MIIPQPESIGVKLGKPLFPDQDVVSTTLISFILLVPDYREIIGSLENYKEANSSLLKDLVTTAFGVMFDMKVIITQKSDRVLVTNSHNIIDLWPTNGGGPDLMQYISMVRRFGFKGIEVDPQSFLKKHNWEHVPKKMEDCLNLKKPIGDASQPV